MGLPFKKLLRGAAAADGGVSWLLRDDFTDALTAGNVHGTPAVPGPGTRVVVDTGNTLSLSGGYLTTARTANYDPGLYLDGLTRVAGRLMVAHIQVSNVSNRFQAGWTVNQAGQSIPEFIRSVANSLRVFNADLGTSLIVAGRDYYIAIVLRSTGAYYFIKEANVWPTWTLLYITNADSTATLYVMEGVHNLWGAGNNIFDFLRVPDEIWLPTQTAYDTFTRANGAMGSSEATGPESQSLTARAWTGATFTIDTNKAINIPSQGAEIMSDPGLEGVYVVGLAPDFGSMQDGVGSEENVIVHGGGKAQKAVWTLGTSILSHTNAASSEWWIYTGWVQNSAGMWINLLDGVHRLNLDASGSYAQFVMTGRRGNWMPTYNTDQANTYYVDDISLKQLTLSELFSSMETSQANVVIDVDLVLTKGTNAGLVLRLDSAATPANFILAYHDGTNIHLEKCVAGTYTSLINIACTYSANATMKVILDGSKVTIFYNNYKYGTTQTISDVGILSNTIHGLFSTYPSNTMDNFIVANRNSDEDYIALDRYIGE
jgi:hypothetical protein